MRIASAGATSSFGVNGPYQPGIATTVATNDAGAGIGLGGRDAKIVYTSPAVGGIQLGVELRTGQRRTL